MRYQFREKLLALVTASTMTITACGGSEQIKAPVSGSAAQFAGNSQGDDVIADAEEQAAKNAQTSTKLNRAKALDQLNQEINRDVALKAQAMEAKVKLEAQLTTVKQKGITNDKGTAVGSGVTAVLCTALAITAGVLTAGVGAVIGASVCAVGAAGVAIGSGVSNAMTDAEVAKLSKDLTGMIKDVETRIVDLESKINRNQAMVGQLIKEGA